MKTTLLYTIKQLFINYPHLRDNVDSTIVKVWEDELKNANYDISKTSVQLFFNLIKNNSNLDLFCAKLSKSWSIRRCWQKVQQDCPELRGKTWNYRHKIREPEERNIMRQDTNSIINSQNYEQATT